MQNDVLSAYTGQTMQVLCEVCKEGFCEGFNTHYIRVRYPSETDDRNRIVAVRSLGHKNGIIISKKID